MMNKTLLVDIDTWLNFVIIFSVDNQIKMSKTCTCQQNDALSLEVRLLSGFLWIILLYKRSLN